METNLEDFLKNDMTKQVNEILDTNNNDAEEEYEYDNFDDYDDELVDSEILDGEGNEDEKYILYKNKKLKVRFALINEDGEFVFEDVEPETFDFLLLIGLDKKDVFYFDLMTKEEAEEKVKGSEIVYERKDFKFGRHLEYKDIENYIESHSN